MKKRLFVIMLIGIFFTQLFCNLPIEVPNDYPTIQQAIDHALTLNGSVTIEVEGDTYNENLEVNLNYSGLSDLIFIGIDGADECIIDGINEYSVIKLINENPPDKFIKISGFTIRNSNGIAKYGINARADYSYQRHLNVEFTDNIIQNFSHSINLLNINDALVKNNEIINDSQIENSNGISAYLINIVIIDGNFISNNEDGIWIDSSNGELLNNKIEVNFNGGAVGIDVVVYCDVDIINNLLLISSEETSYGIKAASESNVTIINNTTIGLDQVDNATGYKCQNLVTTEKFVNNIMWNLETNISAYTPDFEVNYCCYNGTIPSECEPEPLENHNVININPDLTTDYHLSEDSILLIDGGDPNTDGDGDDWEIDEDDQDIDGSRKDMGCYPYLHDYDTKHFSPGWQWVSFPILNAPDTYLSPPNPSISPINDQLYQQAYYEDGAGGLLQGEDGSIGTIDGFNEILGKRYGTSMFINPVVNNFLLGDVYFNNMLFRHEGYKVEVGSNALQTTLVVGEEESAERLPADHVIAGSMTPSEYHWLGFWIPRTQNMIESFGDFWQSVASVGSENWYYSPLNHQRGGDPTYECAIYADNLTLEYGKTYLVLFNEEIENFFWTDTGQPVEKKKKTKTVIFEYTEKADYEAIDVFNIPSNVTEIGVFKDRVCIGAVVVEDTCAQILVYSDNANREPIPFTFEFAAGRGISTPVKNYQVFNMQTGKYESKSVFSGNQEYSIIRFGSEEEMEDDILSIPQLHGNYPNPFNPTTTISFSLPAEQKIELTVYNIKGQKVKQLVSGKLPTGEHSIVWEGKDTNGKSVSTGIYFYKLKAGKKEISRKMLLLK